MREFEGGATRDNNYHKPEFGGFLSPPVLRRFAAYMHKHRMQADRALRASDNWKKGMPRRDYLESLLRHTIDVWESITGDYTTPPPDTEEALCAVIFNAQGLLRELLLEREVPRVDKGNAQGVGYYSCNYQYMDRGSGLADEPVKLTGMATDKYAPKPETSHSTGWFSGLRNYREKR